MNAEYTEEQIRAMVEGQDKLNKLAQDYFWDRYHADPRFRCLEWDEDDAAKDEEDYEGREFLHTPSINNINFYADTVFIYCEARACGCGCCGYDNHTFEFPLSYLWQDQMEVLVDMARRQKEAEERRKKELEAAEERRRKEREKAERKQLQELAKKHPDVLDGSTP